MSKSRLRVLITMGTLSVVAAMAMALAAVLAAPASPSRISTRDRVITTSSTVAPCKPANEMTRQERAALPAHSHSVRFASQCRTAGGIHTTAIREFTGKTTFQMTSINLNDTLCDSRSVYADVYTNNGWLGEYYNSQGCGTDAHWNGPVYWNDVGGNVQYVFIRLYACNSNGCSSYADSAKKYNPYVAWSGNPRNATFNFQNNTGGEIAQFSAYLD